MVSTLHRRSAGRYPPSVQKGLATLSVREAGPPDPPKPRLLDRVREALRTRHYSHRTEQAYVAWIRRFIFFHGKRHLAELGAAEVSRFLSVHGHDIRTELLGHRDVTTTMIYTHVLNAAQPEYGARPTGCAARDPARCAKFYR